MKDFKRIPLVYLAGGMRSNWQDAVKRALPGFVYLDPREHHFKREAEYTAWDLSAVEASDIVLGYIERDNPNGAGLALEFGYGAALGKTLIYVEQPEFAHTRYFGMVRSVADHCFTDMADALRHLGLTLGRAPNMAEWVKHSTASLQAA